MKPHIICYMMTSVDGRIDCAMTSHLKGVDEYYKVLADLNIPTTISGRVTAELEMSLPGKFKPENLALFGHEGFSKKIAAPGYEVILDTKGTLLWDKENNTNKPHLIITSEKVTQDYLAYLDEQNISWIVCGKEHIDLVKAMEILGKEFGVQRIGVVGGPAINTSFLEAKLLDEVVLLIGPGIDGRAQMPSVFEGRTSDIPLPLKLKEIKALSEGTVYISYSL